jgi:prepilin-type N-terminal cleavage/methylation domain-containing protein
MSTSRGWRRRIDRLGAGAWRSGGVLRGEAGFTLPELLITVVITSVIVLCLSSAFVVAAKTTVAANIRLQESHDAQLLTTYFPADAASANQVETNPAAIIGSKCPVPGDPVVLFTWTESGVRRDAFYGRPAGALQLVRQYCENNVQISRVTVVKTLAAGAATTVECPTTAACKGSPSIVKLTVQHHSGLYRYSIQGSPRATTAKTP